MTIGAWVALMIIASALNVNLLESATTTEFRLAGSFESERASALLAERLPESQAITEIVVVQSESLTVEDPAFREQVDAVFARLLALGSDIVDVPLTTLANGQRLVSADGTTTLIPLVLTGSLADAEKNIGHVLDVIEEANASDGLQVLMVGPASVSFESLEFAREDLEQGERFGIPVALIILLVLFGAVVAALVPIGLAVVSIAIALGLVALIGQVFELSFFVTLMVTMIGLAVGIDYSLLIISRFRKEMGRGLSTPEAVAKTGDTAGRTVLFSGVTVMIALCGLLIVPFSFFQSLGIGATLVVLVALAATLTLLPAVLALLGPSINRLPLHRHGQARGLRRGSLAGWILGSHAAPRDPLPGRQNPRHRRPDGRRDAFLLPNPDGNQRSRHIPGGRRDEGSVPRPGGAPEALVRGRQPP